MLFLFGDLSDLGKNKLKFLKQITMEFGSRSKALKHILFEVNPARNILFKSVRLDKKIIGIFGSLPV